MDYTDNSGRPIYAQGATESEFADFALGVVASSNSLILEFSKPKKFPIKQLFSFYSKAILPILGSFISKDKSAYHYLPASVDAFPEGISFNNELDLVGFLNSSNKILSGGISSIYVAEKP